MKSLNQTPNKQSFNKGPEQHDKDVTTASLLMTEPIALQNFMIYELITSNKHNVRRTVEEVIETVNENVDENVDELREQISQEMKVLNKKIDILLPKKKKDQRVFPLRDLVTNNLLPIFLTNAGNSCQRKKELIRAQLRITYTILYHCGLRINEIRHLNQEDLQTAIEAAQSRSY